MTHVNANLGMKSVVISARVIRADGRVEELGIVSAWHKNPFIRAMWKMRTRINGYLRNK